MIEALLMRRLVVEFSAIEPASFPELSLLERVKSLEMLHILKMTPEEFAAIVRVELKDPSVRIEDLFPLRGAARFRTELLQKEKGGNYTYFISIKMRRRANPRDLNTFRPIPSLGSLPYLITPFELRDGKLTLTLLGNSRQVRTYLEVLENSRTRMHLHYKVVSLMDARFPPSSPITRLTEKQRQVLITAYRLGYYDVPRKITSEELAKKVNLVKSTLSAHVRKAEHRLLTEMLSEYVPR
jgi:hypothetical protein